ncbi:vesicle-associated protein 1-2-like [Hibiscus syriacus]|uniref:vesicle-associated protein 1-2-like n=1 Tax=Hibiscus syriacus TaxID=106335 RepID=UPI00192176C5|nr:vesicle-associated protein 1-2-like [Hibiscus syriacus]
MSTGELLNVDPVELKFPFELKKQISCSLQLSNKTDDYVAFKVKTTNPKKYCVRPNTGIVLPKSTCEVIVTMQAQKDVPADMQCKDKFLLQTVKAPDGATPKDITAEMFNREAGNVVEECKLRVVYVFSPQDTAAHDGSEVGSSMRGSVSDNGQANATEFVMVARTFTEEVQDKSPEAKALITKLTEEKNKAIQQNDNLRKELELLKRETSKGGGGLSFMLVLLIGLVGLITGYIIKRS